MGGGSISSQDHFTEAVGGAPVTSRDPDQLRLSRVGVSWPDGRSVRDVAETWSPPPPAVTHHLIFIVYYSERYDT